ncbi:hypothetical protein Tco_0767711 [Tanacetum coccineum]
MLPSPRKACHVCLALPGRANTGLGLVLAHHTLFVWLGLRPIVIIQFRAKGLILLDSNSDNLFSLRLPCLLAVPRCNITDIKSVLSQKSLDMFSQNFHIPYEVHPQLPSPNQTIHEMPTGKIGVYTRFFEAAKVSHFEIMCRVHGFEPTVRLFRCFYVNSKNKGWMSFSKRQGYDAVCYTKPLDSLKGRNDHFFWVDAFACPASFPWHTSKSVSKDPFPKSSEFNADHYATLVAYPTPFHKYPEPFLCLVGMSQMDFLSFIRTADPTKVIIGERQRTKGKPKLLDITVGRVVPLLPVAPARTEGELEASVDKLFDEEGSGNQTEQGDSVTGGEGADIQLVSEGVDAVAEDVAPLQPRRQKNGYLLEQYGMLRFVISALQHLQSVNFFLIAELKTNKDASIETIMNLLRLEDTLAEKLGLTELQPHVDQLMVPIHHSPDQRVIGASALSLSLDVSDSVESIYT